MRCWTGGMIALACFAAVADARTAEGLGEATTGVTYFNRAGATMEEHQAALDRCAPAVAAMNQPNILLFTSNQSGAYGSAMATYGAGPTAGALLILGAVDAARLSAAQERAEHTHYQNCMVAQGWRLVRLENATGRRLSRLDPARLAEQLAPLIAAEAPEGVIEREFTNDLATGGAVTRVPTGGGRFVSLSRRALPRSSPASERPPPPRRPASAMTREESAALREEMRRQFERQQEEASSREAALRAMTAAPIEAVDPSTAAPDSTLVVFRQSGATAIVFRRLSEDGAEQRDTFVVGRSALAGASVDKTEPVAEHAPPAEPTVQPNDIAVLAVPPGRWRMESMQLGASSVSLCMNAPAFEVAAGEVVYLGDFSFAAEPFVPDMSLAPAHAALSATPHFAERLRAASYVNGTSGTCWPADLVYGYEVPAGDAPAMPPTVEAPAAN